MGLFYKTDWEETKKNYEKWWSHQYFGRCAIAVYAPNENSDISERQNQKAFFRNGMTLIT